MSMSAVMAGSFFAWVSRDACMERLQGTHVPVFC